MLSTLLVPIGEFRFWTPVVSCTFFLLFFQTGLFPWAYVLCRSSSDIIGQYILHCNLSTYDHFMEILVCNEYVLLWGGCS